MKLQFWHIQRLKLRNVTINVLHTKVKHSGNFEMMIYVGQSPTASKCKPAMLATEASSSFTLFTEYRMSGGME